MRKALNENPLVQAIALGLLALLVGFMLFTRVLNRSEPEAPPATDPAAATAPPAEEAPAPADASAPEPTAPADPAAPAGDEAATPAAPATESAAPPAAADEATADAAIAAAAAAGEFVAGPGLPAKVVSAYADGKVIALLIVREGGIDDRKLRAAVESLRARGDTAVFVTRSTEIADYSRITRGVDVERTPALVVLRPRNLTKGEIPSASVDYGFRGPESVKQAIEDALYEGRDNIPYHPE